LTYRQVGTNSFTVKYYVEKFILDMNTMKIIRVDEYRDKKKINRPAGSLFFVYKTSKNFDFIKDKKVAELTGQSIVLSDGRKPILLHTYSQAGGIEVIDYRCSL